MNIQFKTTHIHAVTPIRSSPNSAGYNVVATDVVSNLAANTVTYFTGIAVSLPKGTYFDIRALDNILSSEWVLARGAVIDVDDGSEISLTFRPINEDIDVRSEHPYKIGEEVGQLILCKHQIQTYEEVEEL